MNPLAVVVLTEESLTPQDAARLAQLHPPSAVEYHVLVPADRDRSLLADVLDHLSLLELREAIDAIRRDHGTDRAEAAQLVSDSVTALTGAGLTADGEVAEGEPMKALVEAVAAHSAGEVIVVTRPHAVEDTFHTDWASQARDRLGVPVLHVYAGSSWLG